MAKVIIKKGCDKIFYHKCTRCATDFSYQSEDVYLDAFSRITVECPCCEDEQKIYFEERKPNVD